MQRAWHLQRRSRLTSAAGDHRTDCLLTVLCNPAAARPGLLTECHRGHHCNCQCAIMSGQSCLAHRSASVSVSDNIHRILHLDLICRSRNFASSFLCRPVSLPCCALEDPSAARQSTAPATWTVGQQQIREPSHMHLRLQSPPCDRSAHHCTRHAIAGLPAETGADMQACLFGRLSLAGTQEPRHSRTEWPVVWSESARTPSLGESSAIPGTRR